MDSPTSSRGKFDQRGLASPDAERPASGEYVAPLTELEKGLVLAWQNVLQVDRVGVTDDFFELISEMEQTTGIRFDLTSIFSAPTIRQLTGSELDSAAALPSIARIAEGAGPFPISLGQLQMWIEQARSPESSSYNVPVTIQLDCRLDTKALERSLNQLIARHEALRTTFSYETDLQQEIVPESWIGLPVLEVPEGTSDATIDSHLQDDLKQPFDLSQAPFRMRLHRLSDRRHVLNLIFHHVAVDEWSIEILLRELSAFYRAEVEGRSVEALPEQPLRNADFAQWRAELIQSEIGAQQLDYWADKLDRATPDLALPTDLPPPAIMDSRGAEHRFAIETVSVSDLETFARKHGTTLFTLLLAAYQSIHRSE